MYCDPSGTLHTPLPPTERRCTGDLCAFETKSQNPQPPNSVLLALLGCNFFVRPFWGLMKALSRPFKGILDLWGGVLGVKTA